MRTLAGLAGLACLLMAGSAAAKQTEAQYRTRTLLKQIADATEAKDADKGAKAIAELVTLAFREKSLDIEERAVVALDDLMNQLDGLPRPTGDTVTKAGPREALAIVMKSLEPARHGLFLSAHALAGELVLRAGENGDAAHLDAARSVLQAYSATPKCGKAGPALLALADAIHAVRAGSKEAAERLSLATGQLQEGGWLRPSLVCAFERLGLLAAAGDISGAEKVVAEIGARLHETTTPNLLRTWRGAIEPRMKRLPEVLYLSLRKVLEPYWEGAPGAGGRGGDDVVGPNAQSPLGKAWQRLSPPKPIASVKRLPTEFRIELGFSKGAAAKHPAQDGQTHWSKDGLAIAFGDGGAALLMLDLVGNRGEPGDRSGPSPAQAWYWLAPQETWVVTQAGVLVNGP